MDLKQFLELFNPLPGNCYLQVTTEPDATTTALDQRLQSVHGELRVAYYTQDKKSFEALNIQTKQQIDNFSKPFRALPRDHDVLIFKDILSKHTKPKQLLKIAYTTLANAAHIVIMEKKGVMDIPETLELLEEYEFRSANSIEVLEGYDLIMAKKVHMWGNGL
ncbi:hypothetical protein [Sulfurimonas sp.]|uniref:hypothetical protein n=1 Tax=Sulfurimonas sp. TaxID=2022749 RepID=UPI003D1384BC